MTIIKTETILGYSVAADNLEQCIESITEWIRDGKDCRWLACFNPHSYVEATKRREFFVALRTADWLVPDGAGIVLASRVLKGEIRDRITGSDVFREVHRRLNESGGASVFLLGATEETVDIVRRKLEKEFQNIRVVGAYSPPFKPVFSDEDNEKMLNAISLSCADILWVGLSAPKQELWICQNRERLNVRFAAAVGAVFDFYSGKIVRSSPLFQHLGLEWLPRLLQEPRRLWTRMLISAPIFLCHLARSRASTVCRRTR
jgi:N-acetylglucosaminyldiphosphoundecaprenol N-acetyl-beta-D-mannosaminyltransferase